MEYLQQGVELARPWAARCAATAQGLVATPPHRLLVGSGAVFTAYAAVLLLRKPVKKGAHVSGD